MPGIVLFALACGAAATATPEPTPTPQPALPDTNAESVIEFLQRINYQETWELWPGTGKQYQGAEPHGMLLTTYVNQTALEAINNKAGTMPGGSIIVKENYTPDGVFDATTTMYKVDGYNPENNDWFWSKVGADGVIQAEGQVVGCQACHSAKRDNDYVWTGPIQ